MLSVHALLNTTEVTQQQCSVSFEWQPTNDLTSPPPVDLWGRAAMRNEPWVWPKVGDAGTSGADDGTATTKKKDLGPLC